jgi:hypothetical protein
VVDEIEKRCEVGESDFPGLGFATVGDARQESLNEVNREFLQLSVAMIKDGYYDFTASRAYYAMFYVASALLANFCNDGFGPGTNDEGINKI